MAYDRALNPPRWMHVFII